MSGILGLINTTGKPVAKEDLAPALAALAHRGVDGRGHWTAGPVGLGHLLLCTTPEALREAQPLSRRGGELVITADARLDNRGELRDKLGWSERPLGELTDSALILAAYERWGEACTQHLLGDFAFAIWDSRRQALFCARDHMGVRPFYYYRSPQHFAFASEIKGLLRLPGVTNQVDDARVVEYLSMLESADRSGTFYKDVLRLPPGHQLVVDDRGLRVTCYWALDPTREIRMRSDAEYAERFREIFCEAVRTRLQSSAPVGSILSGGLDSACVTCVARAVNKDALPLHTFSAFFSGEGSTDERRYVDAVLAEGGLIGHRIDGNHLGYADGELEQIVRQVEEPIWYVFLLVLWRLYALAQGQGVRVLLDGVDGDSVVAGCHASYLPELLLKGRFWTFAEEINGCVRRANPATPREYLDQWRLHLKVFAYEPLLKNPLRRQARRLLNKQQPLPALLSRNVTTPPDLRQRLQASPATQRSAPLSARSAHYARLVHSGFPFHLEMLDRAAALFGLEYRHPFFDKRLVEFCLALPGGQRFHDGLGRAVMRRGLRQFLPDLIYRRLDKGINMHGYLKAALQSGQPPLTDIIVNGVPAIDAFVDRERRQAVYRNYLGPRQEEVGNAWFIASLALWLRQRDQAQSAQQTDRVVL